MVDINGSTIFEHQINSIKSIVSIKNIHFIVGYKKNILISYLKSLNLKYNLHFHYNEKYRTTGCSDSLMIALNKIKSGFIYLNSDLIISNKSFINFVNSKYKNLILLRSLDQKKETVLQKAYEVDNKIKKMDLKLNSNYNAEAVGPVKFTNEARMDIIRTFNNFSSKERENMPCYTLFGHYARSGLLNSSYINDEDWVEINTIEDHSLANNKVL